MYYAISMYLADDAGRNGNISHNASLHFSAGLVKFSAYPPPSPVIHPFIWDDTMGQRVWGLIQELRVLGWPPKLSM